MKITKTKFIIAGILALSMAPQAFAYTGEPAAVRDAAYARFSREAADIAVSMRKLEVENTARRSEGLTMKARNGTSHAASPVGERSVTAPEGFSDASQRSLVTGKVVSLIKLMPNVNDAQKRSLGDVFSKTNLSARNLSVLSNVMSKLGEATLQRIASDAEYAKAMIDYVKLQSKLDATLYADDFALHRLASVIDNVPSADLFAQLKKLNGEISSKLTSVLPEAGSNISELDFNRKKAQVVTDLTQGLASMNSYVDALKKKREANVKAGIDSRDIDSQIEFANKTITLYQRSMATIQTMNISEFNGHSILNGTDAAVVDVRQAMQTLYGIKHLVDTGKLTADEAIYLKEHCGV